MSERGAAIKCEVKWRKGIDRRRTEGVEEQTSMHNRKRYIHLTSVRSHISKGIENMRKILSGQVLWLIVAAVDCLGVYSSNHQSLS